MWDQSTLPVDNLFGDDAGFLSWLWIEVEEQVIEETTPETTEVDDADAVVDSVDTPAATSDDVSKTAPKDEVPAYAKRDITPTLTAARVIKKAEPAAPKEKKSITSRRRVKKKDDTSAVDDLIKKKTGGYMDNLEWRGSSRGWKAGVKFSSGRARTGWRGPRRPIRGGIDRHEKPAAAGKLQLGRTARKKSTSTRDIIAQQSKREKTYKVSQTLKKKETIMIGETITVKEFSEKMWVPLPEVMKVLLSNKIIVAAQASIDFDTASLIGAEFDVHLEKEQADLSVEDIFEANLESILEQDKESDDLMNRPPIVTVMGHVDHGKTKLLDHLRSSDIVWGEAGGITQSIWASQITHEGQKITFIDTPGHELFSSLRARGSKITNIVIIVVAADDGVKPQTVEAIRHAKDAWVPIIVAITKSDLWLTRMDEIKWQLSEQWLTPEERGGETMIVPCSAMTGQGISDLLEAVMLQAEMLELQYSPSRPAVWVVIESKKDAKQWVQTSLLVMSGTLRVWDVIVIHDTYGRVRKMTSPAWKPMKEATGWDPVMILGINDVPEPGRMAEAASNDKEAQKKIALLKEHEDKHTQEVALQSILDRIQKGDAVQIKLILKADSSWSLEAIRHSTTKIPMPENIEIKIIHDDVWGITDSDLAFARAANALVIGYNVPIPGPIRKKADQQQITIKQYDIIYEFMEYIEELSQWLIEVEKVETLIGKMNVLALFFKKWKEMIVWGKIIEWRCENGATFKVMRDDDQWANGKITSLQREQESVKIVKEWYECGIKIKTSKKVQEWDTIEFYMMEEVK